MGLWDELEKGKNKFTYKSLSTDDLKKELSKFFKNAGHIPVKDPTRTIVARTGLVGMERFNEAVENEAIWEGVKTMLSELYLQGKVTANQFTKLERLLNSNDRENKNLARKIIESKAKK